MKFIDTKFADAWLIEPKVFKDNRGFFLETYAEKKFAERGIDAVFVQDNHSKSVALGVLRGLHFQVPPCEQAKLVRTTKGRILDVIVDIRIASPTYGHWQSFELTEENYHMLFVPRGFAHGFCTLAPDTEVQYKVDSPYAPTHDAGIRWNDPDLAIDWPIDNPVLSPKDALLPLHKDFDSPFRVGR
ncbi:MAG: dTDP-4-dehydrorhamnose 3,5-epimerase [Chitinivibrionales bacterium]|nr:dTDP-4-dehydrorhamnose 3,5-epimerase [Chitinivibrionales bacterium]